VRCPSCRHADTRVVDSREVEDGAAIRRRRSCPSCSRRFTTVEEAQLLVVKRSGVTEPFRRDKVEAGVRKACQGRPVHAAAIAGLAQHVEETLRAAGGGEVPSDEVGLAVLPPLQVLDAVAYLRYASVYRAFESVEDFEHEIALLRLERESALPSPPASTPAPDVPARNAPPPADVAPTRTREGQDPL